MPILAGPRLHLIDPSSTQHNSACSIYIYKDRRKQISAVILKLNIEVTSSTRYLYEHFLSSESSDRAYIYYIRTNLRFFVRKKVL